MLGFIFDLRIMTEPMYHFWYLSSILRFDFYSEMFTFMSYCWDSMILLRGCFLSTSFLLSYISLIFCDPLHFLCFRIFLVRLSLRSDVYLIPSLSRIGISLKQLNKPMANGWYMVSLTTLRFTTSSGWHMDFRSVTDSCFICEVWL